MESDPGEYYPVLLDLHLLLAANPLTLGIAFFLTVILLICSALISGSEVAYFSISPREIDTLNKENTALSKRILRLLERPKFLLATILIINNFINISIVMISTFIVDSLFPQETFIFGFLSVPAFMNVVVVTFLLVLFGEIAPKVYANLNNIGLARIMSGTLTILEKLSYPLAFLLVNSTNLIEKKMEKRVEKTKTVSLEEIDQAIEITVKDTAGAKQEAALLKSIIQFGNVSVQQIMRSRVDVVAVERETPFTELLEEVRESNYSRIPVYEDSFDQVHGILYAKDLLEHLDKGDEFNWIDLVKPPFYVPENKKIDDLLNDFQEKRMHMAIVVDEYGGTSGIVTLEDVLEEIIGDIKDEFDEHEEYEFQKIDNKTYIFEGKTMLNDVCRLAGLEGTTFDIVKGESNSVAGLLLELTGRFPREGEEVTYLGYVFKIMSVDKRRIKRIKLTIEDVANTDL